STTFFIFLSTTTWTRVIPSYFFLFNYSLLCFSLFIRRDRFCYSFSFYFFWFFYMEQYSYSFLPNRLVHLFKHIISFYLISPYWVFLVIMPLSYFFSSLIHSMYIIPSFLIYFL